MPTAYWEIPEEQDLRVKCKSSTESSSLALGFPPLALHGGNWHTEPFHKCLYTKGDRGACITASWFCLNHGHFQSLSTSPQKLYLIVLHLFLLLRSFFPCAEMTLMTSYTPGKCPLASHNTQLSYFPTLTDSQGSQSLDGQLYGKPPAKSVYSGSPGSTFLPSSAFPILTFYVHGAISPEQPTIAMLIVQVSDNSERRVFQYPGKLHKLRKFLL